MKYYDGCGLWMLFFFTELIMMDEDFGYDDTVGKKEIDVDMIMENQEVTMNLSLSEVGNKHSSS